MRVSTWTLMAGGDREAFLTLYQSHYQALFAYGFKLSADRELTKDCIQELFLEVWHTRPSLNTEVKNVRSYLFTWLRRKISRESSRLAKEKHAHDVPGSFPVIEFSYEFLLIAFQQSEEKKEQLRDALKKLSKKQLEIIELKFFQNLSYRTIASQTSLTPRTVYNLMYEAICSLRKSMKLFLIQNII
ncbi:MAG TPA: sigma-70 family RNA polymerase sigma factor [Puia sp.]|nr:sigma-70 family RNA polymerase sigma factor [Puia sp.]